MLPFCSLFPCFSLAKHKPKSHLIILRTYYCIQGSMLSVRDINEKNLELSERLDNSLQPWSSKSFPPSYQGRHLRAKTFQHSVSVEPQAKSRAFQIRDNQKKTGQNYYPLTWPLKHTVSCPARQTVALLYSWTSLRPPHNNASLCEQTLHLFKQKRDLGILDQLQDSSEYPSVHACCRGVLGFLT